MVGQVIGPFNYDVTGIPGAANAMYELSKRNCWFNHYKGQIREKTKSPVVSASGLLSGVKKDGAEIDTANGTQSGYYDFRIFAVDAENEPIGYCSDPVSLWIDKTNKIRAKNNKTDRPIFERNTESSTQDIRTSFHSGSANHADSPNSRRSNEVNKELTPSTVTSSSKALPLEKAEIDYKSIQTQMVLGFIGMLVVVLALYIHPLTHRELAGTPDLSIVKNAISGDYKAFLQSLSGHGYYPGFKPLYYLTLLSAVALFHNGAPGFIMALNIALIFGCSVCTGLLVLEITGRYGNNLGACPAVWAGLLVAVHPFNNFAAQNPQELAAVSCLFFSLVSIFAMMRYRLISEFRYFVIAVTAFILSLLCADRAILIPVVLTCSFVIPDGIMQPNKIGKSISLSFKAKQTFLGPCGDLPSVEIGVVG